MQQFRQEDAFKSAVLFVAEKVEYDGGFRDINGRNATLPATHHALRVLLRPDLGSNEIVAKALRRTAE